MHRALGSLAPRSDDLRHAPPPPTRTRTRARAQAGGLGPVTHFALTGAVALVVVALVGAAVLRKMGTAEAIRDAQQITRLAGEGIVGPYLTDGVLAGRPAELARLDSAVREHVLSGPVVRVTIWTPAGRIVYSDETRLMGNHVGVKRRPSGA